MWDVTAQVPGQIDPEVEGEKQSGKDEWSF